MDHQINIRIVPAGRVITIEATQYDTIGAIKQKIFEVEGVLPTFQKITLRGKELENEHTLEHYQWNRHTDTLYMALTQSGTVQVTIKTLTGKTFPVDVDPLETGEEIKERIQAIEGVPVDQQRIIFRGNQIVDKDRTLASYGVVAGSEMHLVLRLRG